MNNDVNVSQFELSRDEISGLQSPSLFIAQLGMSFDARNRETNSSPKYDNFILSTPQSTRNQSLSVNALGVKRPTSAPLKRPSPLFTPPDFTRAKREMTKAKTKLRKSKSPDYLQITSKTTRSPMRSRFHSLPEGGATAIAGGGGAMQTMRSKNVRNSNKSRTLSHSQSPVVYSKTGQDTKYDHVNESMNLTQTEVSTILEENIPTMSALKSTRAHARLLHQVWLEERSELLSTNWNNFLQNRLIFRHNCQIKRLVLAIWKLIVSERKKCRQIAIAFQRRRSQGILRSLFTKWITYCIEISEDEMYLHREGAWESLEKQRKINNQMKSEIACLKERVAELESRMAPDQMQTKLEFLEAQLLETQNALGKTTVLLNATTHAKESAESLIQELKERLNHQSVVTDQAKKDCVKAKKECNQVIMLSTSILKIFCDSCKHNCSHLPYGLFRLTKLRNRMDNLLEKRLSDPQTEKLRFTENADYIAPTEGESHKDLSLPAEREKLSAQSSSSVTLGAESQKDLLEWSKAMCICWLNANLTARDLSKLPLSDKSRIRNLTDNMFSGITIMLAIKNLPHPHDLQMFSSIQVLLSVEREKRAEILVSQLTTIGFPPKVLDIGLISRDDATQNQLIISCLILLFPQTTKLDEIFGGLVEHNELMSKPKRESTFMGASFEMVCNQAAWVFDEWRRYIDRINIGLGNVEELILISRNIQSLHGSYTAMQVDAQFQVVRWLSLSMRLFFSILYLQKQYQEDRVSNSLQMNDSVMPEERVIEQFDEIGDPMLTWAERRLLDENRLEDCRPSSVSQEEFVSQVEEAIQILAQYHNFLVRVYKGYATIGVGSSCIGHREFFLFLEETQLIHDTLLPAGHCEVIFVRTNWENERAIMSDADNPDRELNFPEFLEALCRIAQTRFANHAQLTTLPLRITHIIQKHIIPRARISAELRFRSQFDEPSFQRVLQSRRPFIQKVWTKISTKLTQKSDSKSSNDNEIELRNLSLPRFIEFVMSLNIPFMTRKNAQKIFESSQQDDLGSSDAIHVISQMNSSEFEEALISLSHWWNPDPYTATYVKAADFLDSYIKEISRRIRPFKEAKKPTKSKH